MSRNKPKIYSLLVSIILRKTKTFLALLFLLCAGLASIWFFQGETKQAVQTTEGGVWQQLPGWWLRDYFGSSVCEEEHCKPDNDPDNDKLSNWQEYFYKTDPQNQDTNANGKNDGEDVAGGIDPSKAGSVSFELAGSDDMIVGESLLFAEDVKQLINEEIDPNKVKLPEVSLLEFKIAYDDSPESLAKYFVDIDRIIEKNFSMDVSSAVMSAVEYNNPRALEDVSNAAERSLEDFKDLAVPQRAVLLHQYYLGMLKVLPDVLDFPDGTALLNNYDEKANYWYDQTQALSVLSYKADIELRRINASMQ